MAEFASRGVGNAALTTGIIGSAGWLLNGGLGNILGGVLGGNGYANGCGYIPSESMPVNRYEAEQSARIAELETEVKLRDANIYTDQKLNDLRNYVEHKFDGVNATLCQQAVYNATQTATIGCIQQQVGQLYGLTKLVIPKDSICPEYMPRFNSWTAPTAEAAPAG